MVDNPYTARRNDLSFLVKGNHVLLVEQQSSLSKNLPLRMLLYYARLLEFGGLFKVKDTHQSAVVPLDPPLFFVLTLVRKSKKRSIYTCRNLTGGIGNFPLLR